MIPTNRLFQLFSARLAILLCSSLLVSCGGATTTAGIGGTGVTSGEVTGFGSIFVNGIEFNTDNSQFEVDGNVFTDQTSAGLAIGMVVKINGSIDDNGLTGTADSVLYDDLIQGPVDALPIEVTGSGGSQKMLTIFGQEIVIDQASTSFIGTSFDTLTVDDLIEVSGFHAQDASIHATFVEKTGASPVPGTTMVELKGIISSFNMATVTLGGAFSGITINIGASTIIDIPGGLADGLFVEVKGVYQSSTSIDATEIEIEDNDFGDNINQISLQGIVTDSQGLGTFTIAGQLIDASGATISPANAVIEDGVNVEVEGSIVGGILIADEVELRQGSVELKALIGAILPATGEITLTYSSGSLTVGTNGQTRFEDDGASDITLIDLIPDNFVVVKGIDNNGLITATNIRRRAPDDTEIQGSVESFTPASSITILGITHIVDGSTQYEFSSFPTDVSTFFTELKIGDIVQITDNNLPDGIDGIALKVSK